MKKIVCYKTIWQIVYQSDDSPNRAIKFYE